jgi:UDP-N-acetylglucosamine:LPS N-acetylglucosamine transferase
MKKSILDYVKEIETILKKKNIENIDEQIENHLIKIGFYQHERLIHLIVTMLFALLSIISFLYTIETTSIEMIILTFMFIILLIPYIIHYYHLENNVQKLYVQYDKLVEKRNQK